MKICFCKGVTLWKEDKPDTICNKVGRRQDASNQAECQKKCEAITTCPGIVYSYKVIKDSASPAYKHF